MTLGDDSSATPDRTPVEEAALWRLPFRGMQVWRVALDVGLELELDEKHPGSDTMVRIRVGGPLLCGPEPAPSAMDPGTADRTELGPALNLFYATVDEAIAHKSGRLEMRFVGGRKVFPVDGWVLCADPDPDSKYEAWEVRGPGGYLMVCNPGGELSVWSGESIGTVGELRRRGFFDGGVFRTDR